MKRGPSTGSKDGRSPEGSNETPEQEATGRWHVVCHDCRLEEIEEYETNAKSLTFWHRRWSSHDVEYAQVGA